jgi:nicotinate-nucleotide adenylyltransferase
MGCVKTRQSSPDGYTAAVKSVGQHIGIFGGSFDPVHTGHLLVAQAAIEELQLARLFLIPVACSPFKLDQQPTLPAHRLAMLRLAFAGRTDCEVDDLEIQRGGTSFTIDTLRHFAQRFTGAKLFYLIGADNVPKLNQWRDANELATLAEFVVIPRPGDAPMPLPSPFRGRYLSGFPFGVSASQIRERVKEGLPLEPLVPAGVAQFIQNNRLYL